MDIVLLTVQNIFLTQFWRDDILNVMLNGWWTNPSIVDSYKI